MREHRDGESSQAADQLLGWDGLRECYERFAVIAGQWTEVAGHFFSIAKTETAEPLDAASDLLVDRRNSSQLPCRR